MFDDALKKKTADTARLYFEGVPGERPYDLWRSFDPELAKELSLFITGRLYAREVIPHRARQMVTVAALAALGREEELRLHLHAALNVGVAGRELAEVLFQTGIYAGVPAMNQALKTLREVLTERNLWPLDPAG